MEITERFVLDSLNSIDIRSCLLASTYADLETGEPLCDLVARVFGQLELPGTRRSSFAGQSRAKSCVFNINLVLEFLSLPWSADEILANSELLLNLYEEVLKLYESAKDEPEATEQSLSMELTASLVPLQMKKQLYEWLMSMNILNRKTSMDAVPHLSRDGVILASVINYYEGRAGGVKGLSKSERSARQNIAKVLEFLRNIPKFHSEHLWNAEGIRNAEEIVIWGIIRDLKLYYCKFSPPRNRSLSNSSHLRRRSPKRNCTLRTPSMDKSSFLKDRNSISRERNMISKEQNSFFKGKTSVSRDRSTFDQERKSVSRERSTFDQERKSIFKERNTFDQERKSVSRERNTFDRERNTFDRERKSVFKDRNSFYNEAQSGSRDKHSFYKDRNFDSNFQNQLEQGKHSVYKDTHSFYKDKNSSFRDRPSFLDEKTRVESDNIDPARWIDQLGLSHLLEFQSNHFLQDPLRNGVLFAELVSMLEQPITIIRYPTCINDARKNIRNALETLQTANVELPIKVLHNPDGIMKGSTECAWGLLQKMANHYTDATCRHSSSVEYLPYSSVQIECLQKSLVDWISSFGVLDSKVQSFGELVLLIRNGILLASLVSKILEKPICGLFKPPKTAKLAISNIEKSLVVLQKDPKMSLKFVWNAQAIYDSNVGYIAGLLEDIHRMSDGAPPRKRGKDYHKDGPYLGVQCKTRYSSVDLSRKVLSYSMAKKSWRTPLKNIGGNVSGILNKSTSRKVIPKPKSAFEYFTDDSFSFVSNQGKSFEWLEKLGIDSGDIYRNNLENWKNGVLLCKIIGKLEKCEVAGVNYRPHTRAAAYQNVQKAFKVLRSNPKISPKLMYCEGEVMGGDGTVIRMLLQEIKRLYKIC